MIQFDVVLIFVLVIFTMDYAVFVNIDESKFNFG